MKINLIKLGRTFIMLAALMMVGSQTAFGQGTAFTYQGRLNSGANAASGSYDLTFSLFNVVSGTGQVGNTLTNSAVAVSNGLFTVALDFGVNFPGADRWLEIGVRTNGNGPFTTLTPRQKLTATPYAVTAGNLTGAILLAQLPGAVVTNNATGVSLTGVSLTGTFAGNGASLTNLNPASLTAPAAPTVVPITSMAFIPPGSFLMGSPTNEVSNRTDELQHIVTISRGFWMGKFEVTQSEYLSLMNTNPSFHKFGGGTNLSRPVEQVSWNDATNYCATLTQRERSAGRIPTNYGYRLPTEAEWEYAARAGTTTAFHLGSALRSGKANFNGLIESDASVGEIYNPGGIYLGQTTFVGLYQPNSWGLYDMIGNVWEWCQDWYASYPAGSVIDPQGPGAGFSRINRGGSWNVGAIGCRSAYRVGYGDPAGRVNYVGFRVVLAPGQP